MKAGKDMPGSDPGEVSIQPMICWASCPVDPNSRWNILYCLSKPFINCKSFIWRLILTNVHLSKPMVVQFRWSVLRPHPEVLVTTRLSTTGMAVAPTYPSILIFFVWRAGCLEAARASQCPPVLIWETKAEKSSQVKDNHRNQVLMWAYQKSKGFTKWRKERKESRKTS